MAGFRRAGDAPARRMWQELSGWGKRPNLRGFRCQNAVNKLSKLRDHLINELPAKISHVLVTGHPQNRLPGHASFCIEFIEGESMLMLLNAKGVGVTSGSACTSRALQASHVLLAMGLPHEIAQGSLLFGLGIDNTKEDIDYVLEVLPPIVERLRQMSPLYSKFIKQNKGG